MQMPFLAMALAEVSVCPSVFQMLHCGIVLKTQLRVA